MLEKWVGVKRMAANTRQATNKGAPQFKSRVRLIHRFVCQVFPAVDAELAIWYKKASSIPNQELRRQAMSSIEHKRFHAQGGAIYALYPDVPLAYVSFIVALQTISDYLDNLCDRVADIDEKAFAYVHRSLLDAVSAKAKLTSDYYIYYPYKDDGGYLRDLVLTCRCYIATLPNYDMVQQDVMAFAQLYCEMQTYKHLPLEQREERLVEWAYFHLSHYPELSPWEFSAATGSTLGIFMLGALASDPYLKTKEVVDVKRTYFPWICGLHILLDYLIDQEEDKREHDLNFVLYYKDKESCADRLNGFLEQALLLCGGLNHPQFHRIVVQGLLALYLSDKKADTSDVRHTKDKLLKAGGATSKILYLLCCFLRHTKLI